MKLDSIEEKETMSKIKIETAALKVGDIRLDGFSIELPEEFKNVLDPLQNRVDSLVTAVEKVLSEKDILQAQHDLLEQSNKELQIKADTQLSPEELRALVKGRTDLENAAKMLKLDAYETLADLVLKKKIIQSRFPNLKLDGKSDDYVAASYETTLETLKKDGWEEGLKNSSPNPHELMEQKSDGGVDPRNQFKENLNKLGAPHAT
jgi:hypothetical protein